MQIEAYGTTDKGRERDQNEDAFFCDAALGVFLVCDGMGGHAGGEHASAHTVATVRRAIDAERPLLESIREGAAELDAFVPVLRGAIERACTEIHALGLSDRTKRGMGTTCTALVVAHGRALLAHVGDSRLYLCRGQHVTQLSEDHTYVADAVRQGLMPLEEAEKSPFANVLTRAVGPQKTVIVDAFVFALAPGDTLLLCSDGLHQYTRDGRELARKLEGARPDAVANELVALANGRGGSDNITAVVVRPIYTPLEGPRRMLEAVTDLDALRHIELLREMTMAEVVRLCQAFTSVRFEPGELILREGETSETFFVLVDGSAEVFRGTQRIATLPKGTHFGEMAILSLRARSATVRATSACRALMTDRATLYTFLGQEPMVAAKFFWKLAQTLSLRLDEVYEQAARPPDPKAKGTIRFGAYPAPFTAAMAAERVEK